MSKAKIKIYQRGPYVDLVSSKVAEGHGFQIETPDGVLEIFYNKDSKSLNVRGVEVGDPIEYTMGLRVQPCSGNSVDIGFRRRCP